MDEDRDLTDQSRRLLRAATALAQRLGHSTAGPAHVLMSVWNRPPNLPVCILNEIGIDTERLRASAESALYAVDVAAPQSDTVKAIQERARLSATRAGVNFVSEEYVLLAALQSPDAIVRHVFEKLGISLEAAIGTAQKIADTVATGGIIGKMAE